MVNGGDRADGDPQPTRDAPATTVSVGTRRNEGTATARPKRRGAEMWARQGAAVSSSPSVTASSSTGTIPVSLNTPLDTSDIPAATATSSIAVASPGLLPSSSGETPVFQNGDYACSTTMTLELLAGLLDDYFQHTDITTTATMSYLIVNIHAAASQKTPNDPGAQPSPHMLPGEGKLISDVFKGNLSDKVYTPKKLQQERDTLNNTWFNVPWDNMPSRGYLSTSRRTDDTLMTEDGWPTETFVMFGEFHRLLAGFGTIDPQMAEYNVAGDRDIIFSSGELFNGRNTTTSSAGNVTNGCLPHSASTIPNATSSWAISFVPPLVPSLRIRTLASQFPSSPISQPAACPPFSTPPSPTRPPTRTSNPTSPSATAQSGPGPLRNLQTAPCNPDAPCSPRQDPIQGAGILQTAKRGAALPARIQTSRTIGRCRATSPHSRTQSTSVRKTAVSPSPGPR